MYYAAIDAVYHAVQWSKIDSLTQPPGVSRILVLMLGCTVWISSSGYCVSFPMVTGSVIKSGESLSGKALSPIAMAKSPADVSL